MNVYKLICLLVITSFAISSCNLEKKATIITTSVANKKQVSLAISGMTCEIGCAKTIQSKLSKKEGVLSAKVIFKDSIANIEFNKELTSNKELISFINGIAGGEMYKASEASQKATVY